MFSSSNQVLVAASRQRRPAKSSGAVCLTQPTRLYNHVHADWVRGPQAPIVWCVTNMHVSILRAIQSHPLLAGRFVSGGSIGLGLDQNLIPSRHSETCLFTLTRWYSDTFVAVCVTWRMTMRCWRKKYHDWWCRMSVWARQGQPSLSCHWFLYINVAWKLIFSRAQTVLDSLKLWRYVWSVCTSGRTELESKNCL